jgi:hypothetical protein
MSRSSADEVDPVPRWKRIVAENLRRWPPGKRGIRIRVTFAFVLLALIATVAGPNPKPLLGLLLFVSLLLQELPGALWARALGRFVRVTVSISGSDAAIAGERLPARWRLATSLAGSAANLVIGCGLLLLAQVIQSELLKDAGRLQFFWGGIQLLPLFPFKLGRLLAEHVGHWARVKQAIASLGVAFAVVLKCASYLALPLFLVAFGVWFYACCHELVQSIARARDERLAADERLAKIRAFTLADDPQRALRLARHLVRRANSPELRARAGQALAWAAIGAGDAASARAAITELPDSTLDAHLLAAYLAISSRPREAIALLEFATGLGAASSESLRLLADLYYRVNDRRALAALADSAEHLLSAEDMEQIRRALATPLPTQSAEQPDATKRSHFVTRLSLPSKMAR